MLNLIQSVSAGIVDALRGMWLALNYSPYDHGDFILLKERQADRSACCIRGVSEDLVEATLTIICESFDLPDSQKWCMRLEDNLGDYYRAMTRYRVGDDMEYERLQWAMEERVGEFEWSELSSDINVTIEEVVKFMANRESA